MSIDTDPQRQEAAGGSLLRALKFIKRGYVIQAPSIAGVTARLLMAVRASEKSDGEQELWMTQVLTGLLREVDPLRIVDGVDLIDEHAVVAA